MKATRWMSEGSSRCGAEEDSTIHEGHQMDVWRKQPMWGWGGQYYSWRPPDGCRKEAADVGLRRTVLFMKATRWMSEGSSWCGAEEDSTIHEGHQMDVWRKQPMKKTFLCFKLWGSVCNTGTYFFLLFLSWQFFIRKEIKPVSTRWKLRKQCAMNGWYWEETKK